MKKILIIILVAILLIPFVAVGGILCSVFRKAKPIELPESTEVKSLFVGFNFVEAYEINIEDVDLDELLEHLRASKPTRIPAVNDYPSVPTFYRIVMDTTEKKHWFYIWERREKVYIDIPYEGIYLADEWIWNFVLKYFEE